MNTIRLHCNICGEEFDQGNWLLHVCADNGILPPIVGVKADSDKVPLDLLDPLALEGLAAVLRFGAKKYAAHNWRGGFKWMRLMAALLRHSFAIIRGEDNDPESGLPHIDHIGCCWMFLSNMMKTRPDLDDRYSKAVGADPTNSFDVTGS